MENCHTGKRPVLHIVVAKVVLLFFPLKIKIKNEKLELKLNICRAFSM